MPDGRPHLVAMTCDNRWTAYAINGRQRGARTPIPVPEPGYRQLNAR